jgi:hypothetical protein
MCFLFYFPLGTFLCRGCFAVTSKIIRNVSINPLSLCIYFKSIVHIYVQLLSNSFFLCLFISPNLKNYRSQVLSVQTSPSLSFFWTLSLRMMSLSTFSLVASSFKILSLPWIYFSSNLSITHWCYYLIPPRIVPRKPYPHTSCLYEGVNLIPRRIFLVNE